MLNVIDINIRLSLFRLSGYELFLLDKYGFEPDICVVQNTIQTRAFCRCCGEEVMEFDVDHDDLGNHNHVCKRFLKIHGEY